MRSKETEADYRYFREPDLLPLVVDEEWNSPSWAGCRSCRWRAGSRFMQAYSCRNMTPRSSPASGPLGVLEAAVAAYGGDPKRVSNWVMNDVLRMMNDQGLTAGELRLTPANLPG